MSLTLEGATWNANLISWVAKHPSSVPSLPVLPQMGPGSARDTTIAMRCSRDGGRP